MVAEVVKEPPEIVLDKEEQDQTHGLHGQQQLLVEQVDTTAVAEEAEETTCPIMPEVPEVAEQVAMEVLPEPQELQTPEAVEAVEPGTETCNKVEEVLEGQES